MPNTESAKKRVRQNSKRNALNNWRKRQVKDQVKAFLTAVHDKNVKVAETEFSKTAAALDKVSSTSTMHKNTAARQKSRLHKRLKALQGAPKEGAPKEGAPKEGAPKQGAPKQGSSK